MPAIVTGSDPILAGNRQVAESAVLVWLSEERGLSPNPLSGSQRKGDWPRYKRKKRVALTTNARFLRKGYPRCVVSRSSV
jgi:hypothetical protein